MKGLVFVTLLLLVSACVKEKKAITQTEKVWNLDIENADTFGIILTALLFFHWKTKRMRCYTGLINL